MEKLSSPRSRTGSSRKIKTAVDEVNAARTTAAIARTQYKSTRKEWDARMTWVYAALMADLGKQEANRFFPKHRKPRDPMPLDNSNDNAPDTPLAIAQLAS